MPVNSLIFPARAFSYKPFGSRSSHTSSGALTKISMKSQPPSSAISRARRRSARGGDGAFGPENVLRFDFRAVGVNAAENDAAARDLALIDDDEAAHDRVAVVVVENERTAGLDGDLGDVVFRDVIARLGQRLERRGVNDALDAHDFRVKLLRGELELVALADVEPLPAHPEQARL